MSTPNINCILQALAVVTDQNATNFPQIASFDFQNPTLPSSGAPAGSGSGVFWEPYFQATVGGTSVPFPAGPGGITKAYGLFVQNKSATATITVTYTPFGGGPTSIVIGPGGLVIIFDPSEAGTGISSAVIAGTGGTVAASVLVVV